MQEQVIYKHWIGQLIIFLVGGGLMGFLMSYAWFQPLGGIEQLLAWFAVVVIGLATLVVLYTYSLNVVILNSSGITFDRYLTPFYDIESEVDWNTVQSITVSQGIFGRLFDYGTLLIQTADAQPQLQMTLIPRPKYWKGYIDQYATLGGSASA